MGVRAALPSSLKSGLTSKQFDDVLPDFFGRFSLATSSWKTLAEDSENRTHEFAAALQKAWDPIGSAGIELVAARLIVLEGATGQTPSQDWLGSMFASRITKSMAHDGTVTSTTKVNSGPHRFQPGPVPTQEAFGIAQKLEEVRGEDAAKGACTCAMRLSVSYSATKHDPPTGPEGWCCEEALLHLTLGEMRTIVAQVSLEGDTSADVGTITVSSMAGEVLLLQSFRLHEDRMDALLEAVLLKLECRRSRFRLVFPSGDIVSGSDDSPATLAAPLASLFGQVSAHAGQDADGVRDVSRTTNTSNDIG